PPQVYVNGSLVSSPLVATMTEAELNAATASIVAPAGGASSPATPAATPPVASAGGEGAGRGGVWQVYQMIGAPELLGSTRITVLSQIGWKVAPGEAGAPDKPTPVRVPLARLLLPPDTRVTHQDWKLRSDLRVDVV